MFGLKDEKLIKQQTYAKTEARKLCSRDFWIFLPNVIKIDPYNFELCRFKVGMFFLRSNVYSCSPRLRAASIHQSSPIKPPVSSSSSSSSAFQKDLSRLLDPDISDYDLHRTLSEKVSSTHARV